MLLTLLPPPPWKGGGSKEKKSMYVCYVMISLGSSQNEERARGPGLGLASPGETLYGDCTRNGREMCGDGAHKLRETSHDPFEPTL